MLYQAVPAASSFPLYIVYGHVNPKTTVLENTLCL